jgi:Flp pilus assembly secretin CpaC
VAVAVLALALRSVSVGAQAADEIVRVDLSVGRSYPIHTTAAVSKVSVATPEIADVAVLAERDVVINALKAGETDVLLYMADGARSHYRVFVRSPADRMQIALQIRFAEVQRNVLRSLGVSGLYRDQHLRVGGGRLNTDPTTQPNGSIQLAAPVSFLTVLTDFDTSKLLAVLEAEETRGNARLLAEPTVMAANRDSATFLAGGELPIPIAQGGAGDVGTRITIQWREFGVRLFFMGEVLSDSLVKLAVRPEVSSLDYSNAIVISGFRIPAIRTRRVESTVDVRRDESFIISGLFDDERQRTRTGIPFLMDIPILGQLFSSTSFQRNETELLVVVTPSVIDPMRPRARDVLNFAPDTTLPAREAIEKRLPGGQPEQRRPRP